MNASPELPSLTQPAYRRETGNDKSLENQNIRHQTRNRPAPLEVWCLDVLWLVATQRSVGGCLVLGIWSFSDLRAKRRTCPASPTTPGVRTRQKLQIAKSKLQEKPSLNLQARPANLRRPIRCSIFSPATPIRPKSQKHQTPISSPNRMGGMMQRKCQQRVHRFAKLYDFVPRKATI